MTFFDLSVTADDGTLLPATLALPEGTAIRGGIIPLHPASDPSRAQFLFEDLAETRPPLGIAVLRYDRRSSADGQDVPLDMQARDALAALRLLRQHIRQARPEGSPDVPIGLWGFSQGAWAAPLAASESNEVAFLVLIASTGVTPARQMRYGTREQLRRAGFDQAALDELASLRVTYEEYLRGERDRASAQSVVDRLAQRPWFPLAYVPDDLPPVGSWEDMDFDPAPIFGRVHCPVLLFYGEDDEWTPADESIAAWRHAATLAGNGDVTVVRLKGASHHPTLHGGRERSALSPQYTDTLRRWLSDHLPMTP